MMVVDATCLERNLDLVLQTIEITDKVGLCELMDGKSRDKIDLTYYINIRYLLLVPVQGQCRQTTMM